MTTEIATPDVSVIVTCKGRLHHLQQTLPRMFSQDCAFDYQVIVVDFGCPDGTSDWCRAQDEPRLVALRVLDGTEKFHLSRARNCGANFSDSPVLAFVDADIRADAGWLQHACGPLLGGEFELSRCQRYHGGWDRGGTCAVSRRMFHEIRGFDEGFRNWGVEDGDFYGRIERRSPSHRFSPRLLTPIRHGNEERTRFYDEKSIRASGRQNKDYQLERTNEINPNGYGCCEAEGARGGESSRRFRLEPDSVVTT